MYWEKPSNGTAELEAASALCLSQAAAAFPPSPQLVALQLAYNTPIQTNCTSRGPYIDCRATGGEYVPAKTTIEDSNKGNRERALYSCLYRHGWNLVGT